MVAALGGRQPALQPKEHPPDALLGPGRDHVLNFETRIHPHRPVYSTTPNRAVSGLIRQGVSFKPHLLEPDLHVEDRRSATDSDRLTSF